MQHLFDEESSLVPQETEESMFSSNIKKVLETTYELNDKENHQSNHK